MTGGNRAHFDTRRETRIQQANSPEFLPRDLRSDHRPPSHAVNWTWKYWELVVADLAVGRAEHRAVATIGMIRVGIAVHETQYRRYRVSHPREREQLAQN